MTHLLKITQLVDVRTQDLNPFYRLGNQDSEKGSDFSELTQLEGWNPGPGYFPRNPHLSQPPPWLGERTQVKVESGQWEFGKAGSTCEAGKANISWGKKPYPTP